MARSPLVFEVEAGHETVSRVDRIALVEPVVVFAAEERGHSMYIAEEVAAAIVGEAGSLDITEEVATALVREAGSMDITEEDAAALVWEASSMVYTTRGQLDSSEEVFAAVEVPWRNIIEVI